MATALAFNSTSLQSTTPGLGITAAKVKHHSIPNKNANTYALAHANRSVLPFVNYPSKQITVSGNIKGSSVSDLDSRIDAFKAALSATNGNLDVGYAGGTRRYIATVTGFDIDDDQGLTTADWTIIFTCTNPFGMNTASTSLLTASGNTAQTTNFAPTFQGTAPYQVPVITLTYSVATAPGTNIAVNPGFEVDLSNWYSTGYGTGTRVTTQHNSGVAALQMVNGTTANTVPSAGTYGWEGAYLNNLVVGQTYTMSMWFKGAVGGEVVKMSTYGSSVATLTLTTGWQLLSLTFTATSASDGIYIWSTTSGATWYADDLSVTPNVPSYISVTNHANGQGITIFNQTINPGDVIIFDSANRRVTQNGTEIDFIGSFIEIAAGIAQIDYADGLTTRTFSIDISQQVLFL